MTDSNVKSKETMLPNDKKFEGNRFDVLLQTKHPLPQDPTLMDSLKHALRLPPHGTVSSLLTWTVSLLLLWATFYSLVGPTAAPGGNIFSIILLFCLCHAAGHLAGKVQLPPLLAMLVVGICLRSIPSLQWIGDNIDKDYSKLLRKMALVVILIRGGLGLDPGALKELKFLVLRLAIVPVLVEAAVYGIAAHILLGMPLLWSFMLSFVLSAVSPAVVVPAILHVSERGYGVGQGIPTLIMAAASVDNVINISGFGIMLGITFSNGSLVAQIFQGPADVLIGLGYGVILGIASCYLPNRYESSAILSRFVLLGLGGMVAVFGSAKIGYGGAGALACLVLAFTAGVGWRNQGWANAMNEVKSYFGTCWIFFQTLLFGLMGAQINIMSLDGLTIAWGSMCILVATILRALAAFASTFGSSLNIKEKIYVTMGRFPKATIQAAIGSAALDYATSNNGTPEQIELGRQVLTIAVLIILLTAPIGSAFLMLAAPKLLQRSLEEDGKTSKPTDNKA